MKGPGLPKEDADHYNTTHIPLRSWRLACEICRARGRPHRRRKGHGEAGVPEMTFDFAFVGSKGRARHGGVVFARVVPRKGLAHEHGSNRCARQAWKAGDDTQVLRGISLAQSARISQTISRGPDHLVELRRGGQPFQWAAEAAAQSLGEQDRVLRHGLETMLRVKQRCTHPLIAWMVEHTEDILSK